MFLLTDYTSKPAKIYKKNDIKDVADIVIGITGCEEEGYKVETFCGDMHFGDSHISRCGYTIDCVKEA